MKGLTLRQPWASLMACGAKTVETRPRRLPHSKDGGPYDVVICAGLHRDPLLDQVLEIPAFRRALEQVPRPLPFGLALCVVEFYDCMSTDRSLFDAKKLRSVAWDELEFGNYEEGRYGWLSRNLRRLRNPVPVRGKQGLFNLSAAEADAVAAQLPEK